MSFDWHSYRASWQQKLYALKGSPYAVAAGVACGAAVSFTPFVGAHLVLAIILAWMIRGNIVAAALGTAVGNPWTFPIIWSVVLYTGRRMIGGHRDDILNINFGEMFSGAFKSLLDFDFSLFFSDIWPIFYPMMIGCIPFFVVVWLVVFYGVELLLRYPKDVVWERKE